MVEWVRQHFIEPYLFNATTDIGLPTVYGLFHAAHDPKVVNSVSCATGLTISEAAQKAVLDGLTLRPALAAYKTDSPAAESARQRRRFSPDELAGACKMADPAMSHAFNFLLASSNVDQASHELSRARPQDVAQRLLKHLPG